MKTFIIYQARPSVFLIHNKGSDYQEWILDRFTKMALAEIMTGNLVRHSFYAVKSSLTTLTMHKANIEDLDMVPFLYGKKSSLLKFLAKVEAKRMGRVLVRQLRGRTRRNPFKKNWPASDSHIFLQYLSYDSR